MRCNVSLSNFDLLKLSTCLLLWSCIWSSDFFSWSRFLSSSHSPSLTWRSLSWKITCKSYCILSPASLPLSVSLSVSFILPLHPLIFLQYKFPSVFRVSFSFSSSMNHDDGHSSHLFLCFILSSSLFSLSPPPSLLHFHLVLTERRRSEEPGEFFASCPEGETRTRSRSFLRDNNKNNTREKRRSKRRRMIMNWRWFFSPWTSSGFFSLRVSSPVFSLSLSLEKESCSEKARKILAPDLCLPVILCTFLPSSSSSLSLSSTSSFFTSCLLHVLSSRSFLSVFFIFFMTEVRVSKKFVNASKMPLMLPGFFFSCSSSTLVFFLPVPSLDFLLLL